MFIIQSRADFLPPIYSKINYILFKQDLECRLPIKTHDNLLFMLNNKQSILF